MSERCRIHTFDATGVCEDCHFAIVKMCMKCSRYDDEHKPNCRRCFARICEVCSYTCDICELLVCRDCVEELCSVCNKTTCNIFSICDKCCADVPVTCQKHTY